MQEFWVQGGQYADAKFERIAEDGALESHGPYYTYNDARRELQVRTLAAIAKARVRYWIVPRRPEAAAG